MLLLVFVFFDLLFFFLNDFLSDLTDLFHVCSNKKV